MPTCARANPNGARPARSTHKTGRHRRGPCRHWHRARGHDQPPLGTPDAPTEEPAPGTLSETGPAFWARTPREGTKYATLIAIMGVPDRVTIDEILVTTHLVASHATRGALAGAWKKKLRLEVTAE